MKKLQNIRKKLLRQMAFSVFVMAILPLSTRNAPSSGNLPLVSDGSLGAGQPDVHPEPGRCADLRPTRNQ